MTLTDVRNGMIRLLRAGIPEIENITGEDVSQAEKDMPLLHIQLVPLSSAVAAAGRWIDKKVLVDIAYMEALATSNDRIYRMLERLDGIFKPYFKIGGRAFSPPVLYDITDDIGHYRMTLEFTDTAPFGEQCPLAENLKVNWRE